MCIYLHMAVCIYLFFTCKFHSCEIDYFVLFAHTGILALLHLFAQLETVSEIPASSPKRGVRLLMEAL